MRLNPLNFLRVIWPSSSQQNAPATTSTAPPAATPLTPPTKPSPTQAPTSSTYSQPRFAYHGSTHPNVVFPGTAFPGTTFHPVCVPDQTPAPITPLFNHSSVGNTSPTPSSSTDSIDIEMTDDIEVEMADAEPVQMFSPPTSAPAHPPLPFRELSNAPLPQAPVPNSEHLVGSFLKPMPMRILTPPTSDSEMSDASTGKKPEPKDISTLHRSESKASNTRNCKKPESEQLPTPPTFNSQTLNVSIRKQLKPKGHKERRQSPKRDPADDIIQEEKGDLPEGYTGTYEGVRYIDQDYINNRCNSDRHRLTCGHHVTARGPCGINCHKPDFKVRPFKCMECYDAVMKCFELLSMEEKARLAQARADGQIVYEYGYRVAFVSKHLDINGIAETVLSTMRADEDSRKCEKADRPESTAMPLADYVRMHHISNARDRFRAQNTLNASSKRKNPEDDDTTHKNTSPNKKQKCRFARLRQPASTQKCAMKRKPAATHEAEGSPKTKRVTLAPPINFVDAKFAPMPTEILGAIVRKRCEDVMVYRPKKRFRDDIVTKGNGDDSPRWAPGWDGTPLGWDGALDDYDYEL